jgi:hypothetical protein
MAWYKDPDTNEIKEVDIFEKNNSELPSIKSIQSTMLVVPFNVPYEGLYQSLDPESASGVADTKAPRGYVPHSSPAMAEEFQKAWFPWNMKIQKGEDKEVSYSDTAVDIFKFNTADNIAKEFSMVRKNRTVFKDSSFHTFNIPAAPNLTDPIRSVGRFSEIRETSLKGSDFYSKKTTYAFNAYDIKANSHFANKNSKYWLEGGEFKNGTFDSHIQIKEEQNQKKSGLTLMEEKMVIKGSTAPSDNEWNPIIMNFKHTGMPYDPFQWTVYPDSKFMMPKNANDKSYRDCVFEIKKPFLEKAYESTIGDGMISTSPVNIQGHYNFYLPTYEKGIADYGLQGYQKSPYGVQKSLGEQVKVPLEFDSDVLLPIPEPILPNIYALIYDQISEEKYFRYPDQGSWMPLEAYKYCKNDSGFLNFGFDGVDNIDPNDQKFLVDTLGQFLSITTKKNHKNETPVKNIAEYLDSWVVTMGTLNAGPTTEGAPQADAYENPQQPAWKKWKSSWLNASQQGSHAVKTVAMLHKQKKYNVTGMSAYKMKELSKEAEKLKKMFPFYVDINLPMANSGKIGQLLFESGLTDIFMQNIMAALYTVVNNNAPGSGEFDAWMGPEAIKEFYNSNEIFMSTALSDTCVIRKDGLQNPNENSTPKQDTMFSETLIHLWLNSLLETSFMLDLDAAPVATGAPLAEYFKNLPPQNYEWINAKSAKDYLEQVMELKGLSTKLEDSSSILKPVVFGKAAPKAPNSPLSLIKWLSTKNKINKFINSRTRSVSDIYGGKKAHSEVLFYEVVKYSAMGNATKSETTSYNPKTQGYSDQAKSGPYFSYAPESGPNTKTWPLKTFIQSFFIPNIPGENMSSYIDTQVKHDKGYYYQVYAHTLVIGTQYQYNASETWHKPPDKKTYDDMDGTFHKLNMNCEYKPDVHLIRVPYYNTVATTEGSVNIPETLTDNSYDSHDPKNYNLNRLETSLVWDSPPVFPDAVFLPLYGESDEILISCNFNIGDHNLHPVTIDKSIISGQTFMDENEEMAQVKSRINQKKLAGPIVYSGDDFCGSIDIMRIETKPKSYEDFSPTDTTTIGSAGEGKSNFGFYDKIEPNKDYYYTLRERDVHGNYSNPSPVYMARIVHRDGEAPYTIFKMISIEEMQDKKPSSRKNFMKYVKIIPSLEQRLVKEDEFEEYSSEDLLAAGSSKMNYLIGEVDINKPVWGKKFKFRFTSKKTGKKFDLNLTVKDISKLEKQFASTAGEPDTYSSGKC